VSSLNAKPEKTWKRQNFRNLSVELSKLALVKSSIKQITNLKLTKRNKRERNWSMRGFRMSMLVRRNTESSSKKTEKPSVLKKSKISEKK